MFEDRSDPEQVSEDPACSQVGPACVSIIFAFLPLSSILRIRVVNRRLPDFSVSQPLRACVTYTYNTRFKTLRQKILVFCRRGKKAFCLHK